jgi:hypothetical protein
MEALAPLIAMWRMNALPADYLPEGFPFLSAGFFIGSDFICCSPVSVAHNVARFDDFCKCVLDKSSTKLLSSRPTRAKIGSTRRIAFATAADKMLIKIVSEQDITELFHSKWRDVWCAENSFIQSGKPRCNIVDWKLYYRSHKDYLAQNELLKNSSIREPPSIVVDLQFTLKEFIREFFPYKGSNLDWVIKEGARLRLLDMDLTSVFNMSNQDNDGPRPVVCHKVDLFPETEGRIQQFPPTKVSIASLYQYMAAGASTTMSLLLFEYFMESIDGKRSENARMEWNGQQCTISICTGGYNTNTRTVIKHRSLSTCEGVEITAFDGEVHTWLEIAQKETENNQEEQQPKTYIIDLSVAYLTNSSNMDLFPIMCTEMNKDLQRRYTYHEKTSNRVPIAAQGLHCENAKNMVQFDQNAKARLFKHLYSIFS